MTIKTLGSIELCCCHRHLLRYINPIIRKNDNIILFLAESISLRSEWPSGLYSLRQVTEVKLGRLRPNYQWATSKA